MLHSAMVHSKSFFATLSRTRLHRIHCIRVRNQWSLSLVLSIVILLYCESVFLHGKLHTLLRFSQLHFSILSIACLMILHTLHHISPRISQT